MTDVHVLGIRHHGPGSARSVAEALAELRPDVVLIEGPPELDALIDLAGDAGLVPPVAALVYDPENPQRASFYPLAEFSPEWVALRWAVSAGVRVRFVDLPAKHRFALENEVDADDEAEPDEPVAPLDPIGELAAAAGYDDPERWWEDAVEQRHDVVLDRFAALADGIAQVRERERTRVASAPATSAAARRHADNELREAAMRRELRAETKLAPERIVVVCGAWHAPALLTMPPAAHDNQLLTKLPKSKVAAAWVPWSAGRLTYASGYGAGVQAPGWYRHLFHHWATEATADVATTWLVRVAHALRTEGLDASTASVVEASRLASTLASLRGRPTPGLDELTDAALGVLVDGNPVPLSLIHDQIVIGEELGQVPESAPLVPLAADLARQQKAYRMKVGALAQTITLDLRTPSGLGKSVLLHRLRLLGVPWGTQADAGRSTGTFKEAWELAWEPELSIALVEASLLGTTVLGAAAAKAGELAVASTGLPELSGLVSDCLLAELPVDDVVTALGERAAVHSDVSELLGSMEPLARICRYGTVRGEDLGRVRDILDAVAVRACVGLPMAASGADEEAAGALRSAMDSAHRGIVLLDDPELRAAWQSALATLTRRDQVPGLVAGRAARMQLDAGAIDREAVARLMSRWLSAAVPARQAAGWLDGFLAGDAVLLVHDPALLGLVDSWVASVLEDTFDDVLPLLRRTFAEFGAAERRSIGDRLAGGSAPGAAALDLDLRRARAGISAVARLLGWKEAS